MGKFVECVPNFSEGRDLAKIDAIVDAARSVPGVLVLDVEKDADHNRTVLTFIAPVETAADAMFAPVVNRFHTYRLTKDPGSLTYMERVMAHPAWKEWEAAALAEPWIVPEDEA